MKLKSLKLVPILICGVAIGLTGLAQIFLSDFRGLQLLQRLEWIAYDWRLRLANDFQPPVSDKLGFVSIGDDALTIFSQGLLNTNLQFGLKWPRHIYGRAVRELKAEGAKAVGLDILFADRRPDHGPLSDLFFRQALEQAGNVTIAITTGVVPDPYFREKADGLGDITQESDSDGVLRRVRAFHDYRLWDPLIQNQALFGGWDLDNALVQSNQIVFLRQTRDGAGRLSRELEDRKTSTNRLVLPVTADGYFDPTELTHAKSKSGFVRLHKAFDEIRTWHLGIVLAARELNLDLEKAVVDLKHGRITLPGPNGLTRVIPVDRHGQFLIDWTLPLTDSRLTTETFESLINKDLDRQRGSNINARFGGKLVIVGSTATGNELSDRGATPLEKDTFLTGNNWNVINSVLTGRFIRPSSFWADLFLIVLLGLGAAGLTWKLPTMWASMLVGLVVAGFILLAVYATVHYRYWLPIVTPASSALLTHFGLLTYQAFFEQNERRRIKDMFSKLVSPKIVNELLKTDRLSLIGARGQVTVFFADVRGFTEMTDRSHAQAEEYVRKHQLTKIAAKTYFDQQAQVVLHTVNVYLGLISDIVKKHDGTLDKYIGDCVMAFWGAPAPNERHALACVRAAIDAQRAIEHLNQDRSATNALHELENRQRAANGQPLLPLLDILTLGTGINTGVVTAGLMGSDAHVVNYTVFGRDVNLASRLEGYSGRGRIIVSETTYLELLRDDPALAGTCVPLPPTKLKGFESAVNIFEVQWKNGLPTELPKKSAEKPDREIN